MYVYTLVCYQYTNQCKLAIQGIKLKLNCITQNILVELLLLKSVDVYKQKNFSALSLSGRTVDPRLSVPVSHRWTPVTLELR